MLTKKKSIWNFKTISEVTSYNEESIMSQSGCRSKKKNLWEKRWRKDNKYSGLLKTLTGCYYNPWQVFPLLNRNKKYKAVCANHSSCLWPPARFPCDSVLLLLFLFPTVFFCLSLALSFLAALPGNTWPSTVTSTQRSWDTRKSLTSQAMLPSRSMKITLLDPTTNLQGGKRKKHRVKKS